MKDLECQTSEKPSGDLFLVSNKAFTIFPVADVRIAKVDKDIGEITCKTDGGVTLRR